MQIATIWPTRQRFCLKRHTLLFSCRSFTSASSSCHRKNPAPVGRRRLASASFDCHGVHPLFGCRRVDPVYFDYDGVTLHFSAAADPILYPSAVMERLASSAAAGSIFATLAALPLSLWHPCHPCHLTSMPPLPPSPPCHFASSAAVEPMLYISAAAERIRLL